MPRKAITFTRSHTDLCKFCRATRGEVRRRQKAAYNTRTGRYPTGTPVQPLICSRTDGGATSHDFWPRAVVLDAA